MKENRLIFKAAPNSRGVAVAKAVNSGKATVNATGGITPVTSGPAPIKPVVAPTTNGWASQTAYDNAVARGDPRATNTNLVNTSTGEVSGSAVPPKTLDDFMTVTGQDLISSDFQKTKAQSAKDFKNGITQTDPYADFNSYDEYRASQSRIADQNLQNQSQDYATQNMLDKEALKKSNIQGNAAIAGSNAANGRNLEGQTSATSSMIAGQFKSQMEADMYNNGVRVQQAKTDRAQAMEGLRQAQEANDLTAIEKYRGLVASADQEALQMQTQNMALQTSQANLNKVKSDTLQSNLLAMGEGAANLDQNTLQSMADSAGLTFGQVANMQAQAVLTSTISNSKNANEVAVAQQNLAKLKAESDTWGKTADQQNFEYSQKLSGPQKTEWDKLQSGGDWQLGTSNGVSGAFNKVSGVFKPFDYQAGEFSGDAGTVEDAFNVQDGTHGGQCGHFVAQYTGLNVPDTFSGKMALTDPSLKGATPQVGDVFVSSYSDSGHMGFIQSVNVDTGKAVVKDSNYVKGPNGEGESVGTHEMDISAITGLIRPKPTDTQNVSISNDVEAVLSGRNTLFNIRQTMGRTNQAAAYMQQMRDNITKIDPNFDFVASDAGGKFVSSTFYQKAISAITSVEPNIDKAVELSNQVSRIGVTGVDALLQKGAIMFGNTKVSNFHEAQKLIADEIGLALGQGTVSDMKLQLGFDVTNPSVSQEVFASNMALVKEFISNRKAALTAQRYSSPTVTGVSATGTTTPSGETIDLEALYNQLHPAAIQQTQERDTLY